LAKCLYSEFGAFFVFGRLFALKDNTKTNQKLFTAMTTAIFSQKNICAALGFAMAITIVIKAKVETSLAQQTARFELTKPTLQIGSETDKAPELLQVNIYKIETPRSSEAS
jgi:hypothetical protein